MKNFINSLGWAGTILLIIVVIIVIVIGVGTVLGLKADGKKYFNTSKSGKDKAYFSSVSCRKEEHPEVEFYMKKHTIFHIFALIYQIIHTLINIASIVATLFTVYMSMDPNFSINYQVIFLIAAAVASSINFSFRFDNVAKHYGYAMRIMEKAILIYLSKEDADISILYEANDKAEMYLGQNYF